MICLYKDSNQTLGFEGVGAVGATVELRAPNLEVGGSNLSLCIRFVSLGKALYLRLSLSTQEYKWVPGRMLWH